MQIRIFSLSLPCYQAIVRMTGLMLILSYGGNAQRMLAQTQDSVMAKDTVRQVNVPRRSAEDNEYTPLERFLPPSPQAAALARYGEYPVSLATGIPEISIPLYEIKLGDYTLPISISYHASGIKVDDVASTVGLGWVLNAGGVVTRTILGVDDMKQLPWDAASPGYFHYSYANVSNRMQQIISGNTYYIDRILNIVDQGLDANYDTESDRYTYNLSGRAGIFRYSHVDDRFITLNHDPIIIEAVRGSNCYFTIKDSDGTIYTFAAQETTGVADDENQTTISAWYLTKVENPNGIITLEYENVTTVNYACSDLLRTGEFQNYNNPDYTYTYRTQHFRNKLQYVYRVKLLKAIRWKNSMVNFDYTNDRTDIGCKRLTTMTVKDSDGNVYKTITFDNNLYLGNSADNRRMLLSAISASDEGKYIFQYNNLALPDYPYGADGQKTPYCHTDYWGYYNGKTSVLFIPKSVQNETHEPGYAVLLNNQGADRTPVEYYTKAGILEMITYPTGGSTQFEYELNKLSGNNLSMGGLRISCITTRGQSGEQLSRKEYEYDTGQRVTDAPDQYFTYHIYHFFESDGSPLDSIAPYDTKEYVDVVSEPLFPVFANNSATVLYGFVSESNSTGDITDYFYDVSAAADNIGGVTDNTIHPQFYLASLRDEGAFEPILQKKEVYSSNNTDTPVYEELYSYYDAPKDTFETGCRLKSFAALTHKYTSAKGVLNFYQCNVPYIRYAQTYAIVNRKLLQSRTTIDHQLNITTTENYTYDEYLRTLKPRTFSMVNSDGQTIMTENRYPFQYTDAVCTGMVTKNMVDPVIETTETRGGGTTIITESRYMQQNGWYYPEYQYQKRGTAAKYEKYHFLDYDTHGNPRTVIENQTDKTALVWGFKSSWPVAKISGLSYAELNSLVSSQTLNDIANDSTEAQMTGNLASLRSGVGQNGLVTTYNYKPLFGVSAITAENGYTTYYDYGSDGKLSAIRDNSGPLQQFSYQYARPYTGSNDGTNFVQTKDMLSSTTGKITRQYYDGLGRTIETAKNIKGNYVYTMQTYDQKGRVSQEWLPAPGSTSPDYQSSIADISSSFYNDNHSYSITTYDALGRPTFIQTPGDAWHSAGKGITKEYITNAANSVKRYSAALDGSSLIKNGYYAASTLYAEKTTDEDGKTMTIFTDKRGRKVLERRGASNDTYYIYDDLDQLRFVLSPQYQESGYKDTYGYEYRYDEKGRLVKKILPQTEYTQYWYDTAGRMKFMQDATLRSKSPSLYRFYLYDKFGRLCIQGTCTSCWRGEAVNTVTYNTSGYGFQNTGYTLGRSSDISGTIALEFVNYYDNYDFVRLCNSAVSVTPSTTTSGLQTGLIRKASDGSTLTDAIYYDYKGRPTQTRSISLGSRLTTTTTSYKYWGDVYQTVQTDYPATSTSATPTLTSTTTNNYSATTGLLNYTTLSIKKGTGTAVQKVIRQNEYDGLGRVIKNTRNGSGNETHYTYNLRNWLTEINGLGFHEWLYYADAPNNGTACYNGNISVQKWQASNDGQNRGYKFTYDALNRLSEAVYGANNFGTHQNRYNEKVVEYSANGMIKRFQRRGLKSDGIYGKVDNLHISLDGNRLLKIIEDAGNQTVYGAMEFQSHSSAETQYGYDGNGSLVWDANKQIAHITYDNLNHPKEVQFTNGNRIQYVYSPDGRKLRATWQTAVGNIVVPLNTTTNLTSSQISSTTRTDYIGNVVYTGTASAPSSGTYLNKFLFEAGYVSFTTTSNIPTFHYYTQDHLGNNRAVVNQSGTVEQITHYYPFGGFFADQGTNSSLQPYKYNGKELDRMHGLDLYDYGFRQYDPVVPMFTQQDPMAEKYYHLSPYAYCGNNPVNAVDPTGKEILIQYKNSQGQFQTYHFNGFGGKSISIPKNQFVRDVITAYLYNASNGEINNMIKAATNPDIKIYIRDASDTDVMDVPSTRYLLDAGKHIITWQSRKGVKTTTGGRQSAATGLEHEFDHALNAIEDPAHNMRKRTYNEQYDTEEEKRVIEGSETKMARSHGESIRNNHKGETFDAVSSISLEELK